MATISPFTTVSPYKAQRDRDYKNALLATEYPETIDIESPDITAMECTSQLAIESSETTAMEYAETTAIEPPETTAMEYAETTAIETPETTAMEYAETTAIEPPETTAIESPETTAMEYAETTATESHAQLVTTRSQLPFPPEIRRMIYEYVFTSTTPFVRGRCTKDQRCRHHPVSWENIFISYPCANIHSAVDLSLLLVSRNTYMETFHMYYALNTVHLCTTERLFQFLTRIGYSRRQQLVSVAFHEFDDDAKRAFQVLRTAKRLEHIKFHLPGCCERHHSYLNLPGLAALREVRGLSHVEITSSFDCSDLIAAMMRPRLARYASESKDDDKNADLLKQPRERFPKTEAERLSVGMNWVFGTRLCRACPTIGPGGILSRPRIGFSPSPLAPPSAPLDTSMNVCFCWRMLGQGMHAE